jgi:DMSO/TMAO reductase YedYZ molybdopterin-dependent catalytic subunit
MKRFSRRDFVRGAGSAVILATIPGGSGAARGVVPPTAFGGPTPNSQFYVTSYGRTPGVDASTWRFQIKGLVDNPQTFSYEQIQALPQITETLTLECIGNPPGGTAIGNAVWQGIKLKPILERARVKSAAVWVAMRGADGYYTGLPVDELLRQENFLPWKMNGVALPTEHGYPLRIFIPGKYGMKQPKWITELEFLDHETTGYWEARGWSNSAWRKPNSGYFYPRIEGGWMSIFDRSVNVKAPVEIRGWSLAGPSGIKRVQISSDDGATWHDAQFVGKQVPYVWTVWKYRFVPDATGKYTIRVRATDGNGVTQPPTEPQTGSGMSGQARLPLDVTALA